MPKPLTDKSAFEESMVWVQRVPSFHSHCIKFHPYSPKGLGSSVPKNPIKGQRSQSEAKAKRKYETRREAYTPSPLPTLSQVVDRMVQFATHAHGCENSYDRLIFLHLRHFDVTHFDMDIQADESQSHHIRMVSSKSLVVTGTFARDGLPSLVNEDPPPKGPLFLTQRSSPTSRW
ncbi:hypothetical protein Salat_2983600 [Sesamum alatum]|uniref:Uncharacterized protein n=1 Tax=Sesamum alatum TaxID=300844 RepID=A0AAE1XHZ2_9LAMI|nr:hypothetical protein Salat_2983600 [Sesamum alatum]